MARAVAVRLGADGPSDADPTRLGGQLERVVPHDESDNGVPFRGYWMDPLSPERYPQSTGIMPGDRVLYRR